jgi:hypothetical protein
MPKRGKGLVTGMLAGVRKPGQSRKAGKRGAAEKASSGTPARRVIKTVRVSPEAWTAFRRYCLRRQAEGEALEMGQAVEQAILAYMGRRG